MLAGFRIVGSGVRVCRARASRGSGAGSYFSGPQWLMGLGFIVARLELKGLGTV